jgi:hypothetical protein
MNVDLRRQTELLDQPVLSFSEQVPTEIRTSAVRGDVLELTISVNNIGTGLAHDCGVFYVDSLPVIGDEADIGVYASDEEIRLATLSDCSEAESRVMNALKYQEHTRTSHVNLRIGARGYTFIARRALAGQNENFDLYAAVFYRTQSGRPRMATAWYNIEISGARQALVEPRYVGYVECNGLIGRHTDDPR